MREPIRKPPTLAHRRWWTNVAFGVVLLVLAIGWALTGREHWPWWTAGFALLGAGQLVLGVLNRRELLRRTRPLG